MKSVNETEAQLIQLARKEGILTPKQAALIQSELERSPEKTASDIMLKRHYITSDQLKNLIASASNMAEERKPPPPAPPAPKPASPPPPPARNPAPRPSSGALASPDDVAHPDAKGAHGEKSLLEYLQMARQWSCSDFHITVGRPPFVRRNGEIHYLDEKPLTEERSEELNFSALSPPQQEVVRENLQIDFALEIPKLGRHRCNVYKQRMGWEGAYRVVPTVAPTVDQLGFPPIMKSLTEYHQGLIVVTGPSGSGKTTTVAAMLNYVNATRSDHIITVEDPIEYIFTPIKCQVSQREVYRHTQSFSSALRAALREDPDILLVGEMRDQDTISTAISAAETGHLVFGTLHTKYAGRAVARIVDVFPPGQQAQISAMVAESTRGVIAQQLVPRQDGQGVVAIMEILVFTSAVSKQVQEGRTHQLASLMQSGKRLGMQTMDDSLLHYVREGVVSGDEALKWAENKSLFDAFKTK